jgi:hypothetical protein
LKLWGRPWAAPFFLARPKTAMMASVWHFSDEILILSIGISVDG